MASARSESPVPLLALLAFGSGCAALVYELVWFQLLQFVIGASAVSLAVVLGTFMGGLCLGSLAGPRAMSRRHHPLRVYAVLEIGIGVLGVAVLAGMPLVGRLYVSTVGHGLPGILLRAMVSTFCLLPPTVLMGATLPALGRWLEEGPSGASDLGLLYSSNTIGAVVGCLLSGFYLLRISDLATTTYVAVAINAVLAVTGFYAASSEPNLRPAATPPLTTAQDAAPFFDGPVYVAIALSGMAALGAEVIWTRLLSLFLGPTVYTFSVILACFLAGIGIGSAAGALLSRRVRSPRAALAWCQLLLTMAIALAAYLLDSFFPRQLFSPPMDLLGHFQFALARSALTILPAAALWGASFPLALAAAAPYEHDPGRLVGRVYAANTVGAIVGAIATSLVLLPWLGTQGVHRLLIWASAAAAVLLFVRSRRRWPALAATVAIAWLLAGSVAPVPGLLVAIGKYAANWRDRADIVYMGEGINASVAVSESAGVRAFHVSGEVEASTDARDMQLQRMLGALPALVHPGPRSVLVVGCGAGVTAGSFLPHASVDRLTIVEIEPLIPQVVAGYFRKENYDVVHDPRVSVVYDDARHYVLTTPGRFDIITSDPIRPWVKGSASLYTKEYFELVKAHLNPGGVVTQWVPLYETSVDVVQSEIATFVEVFPEATIWSNEPIGNDLVLLGQAGPSSIDVEGMQARLERSPSVAASLREVGFPSAIDLLATYTGRGPELKRWLAGAEINLDRNLSLQYRAALRLAPDEPDDLYASMINRRTYPDRLFVASAATKDTLLAALRRRPTGGR